MFIGVQGLPIGCRFRISEPIEPQNIISEVDVESICHVGSVMGFPHFFEECRGDGAFSAKCGHPVPMMGHSDAFGAPCHTSSSFVVHDQ